MKMKFAVSLIIFVLCSCNSLRIIEPSQRTDLKEVQLGRSQYYIKLPSDFELSEARGKEGQLGYNIIPKGHSRKALGLIEVQRGHPINGGRMRDWGKLVEKVETKFLNRKTIWKIYETKTGYFVANTPLWNINSEVSSNQKSDIDSLICLISTLAKK